MNGASRWGLLALLVLGGCASAPPPLATLADPAALAAHAQPGVATRASVAAALGSTRVQTFDSGYQVWLYQVPRGTTAYAEFVILFGPDGLVRKTRVREPAPAPSAR